MRFERFSRLKALLAFALIACQGCATTGSSVTTSPPTASIMPLPMNVQLPVASVGAVSAIFEADKVQLFAVVDAKDLPNATLYDIHMAGTVEGDVITLSAEAVKSNRDPNLPTSWSPSVSAVIPGVKVGVYRIF